MPSTPASDQPRRLTIRFCHDRFTSPAESDLSAPRARPAARLRARRAVPGRAARSARRRSSQPPRGRCTYATERPSFSKIARAGIRTASATRSTATRTVVFIPGPQPRIHLIELDDQVEVALRRPVGKIDARERADVADLADQFLVWHGVGADDDALAVLHAAAFCLFEPRRHPQRRQIRHLGDDLSRPRAVARLEVGRRTARAPVRHDGDNTVHGRQDLRGRRADARRAP